MGKGLEPPVVGSMSSISFETSRSYLSFRFGPSGGAGARDFGPQRCLQETRSYSLGIMGVVCFQDAWFHLVWVSQYSNMFSDVFVNFPFTIFDCKAIFHLKDVIQMNLWFFDGSKFIQIPFNSKLVGSTHSYPYYPTNQRKVKW